MKKPAKRLRKGTPAPAKQPCCQQCGAPYVLVQSHDHIWRKPGAGYGAYKATCKCEPPAITMPPKPAEDIMKTPSEHLAALAEGQPHINDREGILVLRCLKCRGVSAWVEWVDFNSCCPNCGHDHATRLEPSE